MANEAQALIDKEIVKCGGQPEEESSLNQLGLRDGKEIVLNYIKYGEAGLALEHVLYMVSETGIILSEESQKRLSALASAMRK